VKRLGIPSIAALAVLALGQPAGNAATAGKSDLRIAVDDELALSVDATQKAYEAKVWGLGETLTRLTRDGKVVPWLAESVKNVDPLTWRITLRKNARFWDGTPVTPEAVAASFRKNWEIQSDVDPLISKQTEIRVVDALTLEFKTAKPTGNLAGQMTYPQFVVHKNGTVMTGPYRPVAYEPDRGMTLEAFPDHWMGTPPIFRIVFTVVPDASARANALLSGAADMVYGLPPEQASRLPPAAYEVSSVPSKKLVFLQFNLTRPPFDDRKVRQATSLAIDRRALVDKVMGGQGAAATSLFPSYTGVGVVPIQTTDVARAKQLLDEAGWRMGPDGVRSKEGRRLAVTVHSAQAAQQLRLMTPLAVAIQEQLRPLGYDVTVQEVPNVLKVAQSGEFFAVMRAINTLPTGDPYYLLRAMLSKAGRTNQNGYFDARVERKLEDLYAEMDLDKRQARSREIQEIVGEDVPSLFLVFTPITIVTPRGRLKGFVPGPNNESIIDATFSVSRAGATGGGR
jgi:peptide/nickel transport system substrate-binding protein